MNDSLNIQIGCLRRGYFHQEEDAVLAFKIQGIFFVSPIAKGEGPHLARARAHGAKRGVFSLDGHRLPSLYRTITMAQFVLNLRYLTTLFVFFLEKISNSILSTRKVA